MRHLRIICLLCLWSVNAGAELHTEAVEYKHGDNMLEGYLAYDNAIKGKESPGPSREAMTIFFAEIFK